MTDYCITSLADRSATAPCDLRLAALRLARPFGLLAALGLLLLVVPPIVPISDFPLPVVGIRPLLNDAADALCNPSNMVFIPPTFADCRRSPWNRDLRSNRFLASSFICERRLSIAASMSFVLSSSPSCLPISTFHRLPSSLRNRIASERTGRRCSASLSIGRTNRRYTSLVKSAACTASNKMIAFVCTNYHMLAARTLVLSSNSAHACTRRVRARRCPGIHSSIPLAASHAAPTAGSTAGVVIAARTSTISVARNSLLRPGLCSTTESSTNKCTISGCDRKTSYNWIKYARLSGDIDCRGS